MGPTNPRRHPRSRSLHATRTTNPHTTPQTNTRKRHQPAHGNPRAPRNPPPPTRHHPGAPGEITHPNQPRTTHKTTRPTHTTKTKDIARKDPPDEWGRRPQHVNMRVLFVYCVMDVGGVRECLRWLFGFVVSLLRDE